jgi:hypothetical protein
MSGLMRAIKTQWVGSIGAPRGILLKTNPDVMKILPHEVFEEAVHAITDGDTCVHFTNEHTSQVQCLIRDGHAFIEDVRKCDADKATKCHKTHRRELIFCINNMKVVADAWEDAIDPDTSELVILVDNGKAW